MIVTRRCCTLSATCSRVDIVHSSVHTQSCACLAAIGRWLTQVMRRILNISVLSLGLVKRQVMSRVLPESAEFTPASNCSQLSQYYLQINSWVESYQLQKLLKLRLLLASEMCHFAILLISVRLPSLHFCLHICYKLINYTFHQCSITLVLAFSILMYSHELHPDYWKFYLAIL